jgi:diguanylate cyclase (GGDEF)-like protein
MNPPPDRPRILIVDDVPVNIRMLGEALRKEYDVRVATSGAKALELAGIKEDAPDLILLDVMMPGMDGYDVCRRLKEDPATRGIPVIFITAKGEVQDETLGLDLGAVDYITKPFKLPIVLARVRTHLGLKRKTDLLESLASIDGLTDIPNRRALDQALDQEWRRASRAGAPMAVIILDVDYFKRYNDRFGHAAGDECLRKVARTLTAALLRPADLAARYGGEEFAAVLPETQLEDAGQVAERIRVGVADLALPHPDSEAAPVVTVSLGVAATWPEPNRTLQELVEKADRLLYEAKSSGRNRWKGEALT